MKKQMIRNFVCCVGVLALAACASKEEAACKNFIELCRLELPLETCIEGYEEADYITDEYLDCVTERTSCRDVSFVCNRLVELPEESSNSENDEEAEAEAECVSESANIMAGTESYAAAVNGAEGFVGDSWNVEEEFSGFFELSSARNNPSRPQPFTLDGVGVFFENQTQVTTLMGFVNLDVVIVGKKGTYCVEPNDERTCQEEIWPATIESVCEQ